MGKQARQREQHGQRLKGGEDAGTSKNLKEPGFSAEQGAWGSRGR